VLKGLPQRAFRWFVRVAGGRKGGVRYSQEDILATSASGSGRSCSALGGERGVEVASAAQRFPLEAVRTCRAQSG